MAVLDPKKTYKNLLKKGFKDSSSRSDDHKYIEFYDKGKLILYTKISHGNDDLRDHLIKQMSSQCKLDKKNFMALATCTLDENGYREILRTQELI